MNKENFHILVVDDDDRIRDLVKQYLEKNNFIVTAAMDAFEAKKNPYEKYFFIMEKFDFEKKSHFF